MQGNNNNRKLEVEEGKRHSHQDVDRSSTAKRPAASLSHQGAKSLKPLPEKTRYETSLCLLARRFLQLLARSADGVLNLNEAASVLHVRKRRVYDITNVLEGVQLIIKKSKNTVQWMGPCLNMDNDEELYSSSNVEQDIRQLRDKETRLDQLILDSRQLLHHMSEGRFLYLTYEDVKSVPSLKEQTVIMIKGSAETHAAVPDPEECLQVYLSSTLGPIDVYVCSEDHAPSDAPDGHHDNRTNCFTDERDVAQSPQPPKASSPDASDHSYSNNVTSGSSPPVSRAGLPLAHPPHLSAASAL